MISCWFEPSAFASQIVASATLSPLNTAYANAEPSGDHVTRSTPAVPGGALTMGLELNPLVLVHSQISPVLNPSRSSSALFPSGDHTAVLKLEKTTDSPLLLAAPLGTGLTP
jgi:hypothetical protein